MKKIFEEEFHYINKYLPKNYNFIGACQNSGKDYASAILLKDNKEYIMVRIYKSKKGYFLGINNVDAKGKVKEIEPFYSDAKDFLKNAINLKNKRLPKSPIQKLSVKKCKNVK